MKVKWWQGSLIYLLILVALLALAVSFFPANQGPSKVDFFTFIEMAKTGQIDTIQQDGHTIIGLKDNNAAYEASFVGSSKELMDSLKEAGVNLSDAGIKFAVKTDSIALGMDDGDVDAYYYSGLCYIGLGNPEKAILFLQDAISISDNPDTRQIFEDELSKLK